MAVHKSPVVNDEIDVSEEQHAAESGENAVAGPGEFPIGNGQLHDNRADTTPIMAPVSEPAQTQTPPVMEDQFNVDDLLDNADDLLDLIEESRREKQMLEEDFDDYDYFDDCPYDTSEEAYD